MRRRQCPGLLAIGEEESHMADRERLHQPVGHGLQHVVEVRFRVQLAGEFDQRAAIVVTVAVEIAVEPLLNPVADRLKQERRDQHDRDQPDVARRL